MGPDASLTPELIQAQSFTTAFRGYDSAEVKSFLARVATEMRAWKERAEGLESAWHSAEERAARPPVLDEDTLMAAVGEETAAILRTARAAAADMRAKAAEESDRALAEARSEAEQLLVEARTEAELVLTEAKAEAERTRLEAESALTAAVTAAEEQTGALLSTARQEATELLERAAGEAEEIRAQAEKDRQLTVEGATSTRDRILEDLSRRRRVATVQIEQLRAGRERLIESYAVVRRTLEEVQSELSRADAEARAAADDVGRRLRDQPEVELSESSREMTDPAPVAEEAVDLAATAEAGGSAVDELFARIRATRPAGEAEETGDAAAALEPVAPEDGGVAEAESAQAGEPPAGEPPAIDGPAAGEPPATDAPATHAPETHASATAAPAPDGPAADELTETATGRRGAKKRSAQPAVTNGRAASAATSGTSPASGATTLPRPTVRVIEPAADQPEVPAAEAPAAEAPAAEAPAAEAPAAEAPAAETPAAESPDSETPHSGTPESEAPVADGDESLMQSREFAVVDLEVNLTRRLKRALQDEQNDVLDRLRNLKGAPAAERLLPDEKSQVERYAAAARPLLAEAATAGALFSDETLGLPGRDAPVDVEVLDLAEECGSGIVSPLRRRLEQAIEAGAGDDQSVLVESLGSAYREWKTQRIERLAGDVLSAAFSRGTWQAAPGGARFRWVVEDTEGPCPDCDDDALAGDIPKGEVFPTGQHHPPAHSGCRCLLVPHLAAT